MDQRCYASIEFMVPALVNQHPQGEHLLWFNDGSLDSCAEIGTVSEV